MSKNYLLVTILPLWLTSVEGAGLRGNSPALEALTKMRAVYGECTLHEDKTTPLDPGGTVRRSVWECPREVAIEWSYETFHGLVTRRSLAVHGFASKIDKAKGSKIVDDLLSKCPSTDKEGTMTFRFRRFYDCPGGNYTVDKWSAPNTQTTNVITLLMLERPK